MRQFKMSMLLMLMMPLAAIAHDFEKDGIYYDIMEDDVSVAVSQALYSQNYEGNIVIPESVSYNGKSYVVKSIASSAFYKSLIRSLTLPKTIRSIGRNAFFRCDSLKTVDIGDLSNWCMIDFQGDYTANPLSRYRLEHLLLNGKEVIDLVIPNDVTEISRNAFYWCPAIHSLEIPGTVKVIGEDAFCSSYNITKLILHEGIEEIKKGGIANMGVSIISLPRSIKRLGENALNKSSIQSVLKNICLVNPNPDEIVLDGEPGLESSFGIVPMVGAPSGSKESYSSHSYWGQFTVVEGLTEDDFNSVVRLDIFYAEETHVKKDARGYFMPLMHVFPGYQGSGLFTCDFTLGLYQNEQLKAISKPIWDDWEFTDWKTCCFSPRGIYIDDIPDGNYQMRVLYRIGEEEWKPMVNNENVYIDVTVDGDEMTLHNRYIHGANLRLESFNINGLPKMGHGLTVSAQVTNTGLKRKGTLYVHVNDMVCGYLPVDIKPSETDDLVFQQGWLDYVISLDNPSIKNIKIVDGEGNMLAETDVVVPEPEKVELILEGIEVDGQHGHLVAAKDNFTMTVKVSNLGDTPYADEVKIVSYYVYDFKTNGDSLYYARASFAGLVDIPVGKTGEYTFNLVDHSISQNMDWWWDKYYYFEIFYYSDGKELLLSRTPMYKWINPDEYEGKIFVEPVGFSREYGDENPASIAYSVYGGELNGTPHIYSETSNETPVGHYYIKCEKGSVANDNVVFGNQVAMAVKKAPLVVTAQSCSRQPQQDNPQFELSYSGFKNGETDDVLVEKPKASTTATWWSEPGTYPIIVSGGSSRNYKFEYVDGILTINESSGIEQFAAEGKWFDVYNMSGQKLFSSKKSLSTLPHGIYIIKGRKVIIK